VKRVVKGGGLLAGSSGVGLQQQEVGKEGVKKTVMGLPSGSLVAALRGRVQYGEYGEFLSRRSRVSLTTGH